MKTIPKDLVFVSYSHRDKKWLERLRVILKPFERQGLNIWADPYIKVGQHWQREIDTALRRTCVAVFLVSPDFLASDFIYEEELPPLMEAAHNDVVTIVCVPISACAYDQVGLDKYQWARDPKKPIEKLPRPRRNEVLVKIGYMINEAASGCETEPAQRTISVPKAALTPIAPQPDGQIGAMFGVPNQRPHYLNRPELQRLKSTLLSSVSQSIGITGASPSGEIDRLGVHGMGGIGKTVLAIALAHDEEIRRAFPDGIIWVTVSQQPDLESLQVELLQWLTGQKVSVESVTQGRTKLTEALANKACLLILDDLWDARHAAAFDVLSPKGRMLITTRDASLLTALGAEDLRLEVLNADLAMELLSRWSGQDRETMPPAAASVAESCGYLPLALALAGARVRDKSLWQDISKALKDGKLEFLDHPYGSIFASMQVSIDALKDEVAERYKDLAVFPEDIRIPETTILQLWSHTGGLTDYESRRLLHDFQAKGLLFLSEEKQGVTIGFHDLQQDFLQLVVEDLSLLHNNILDALDPSPSDKKNAGRWTELPADEPYLWYNLAEHMSKADRDDELRDLLVDARWLQAKLAKTDVNALISDYQGFPKSDPLNRVGGALKLSAHVIANDPLQLASQLTGRLVGDLSDEVGKLLRNLKTWQSVPWLRPQSQSLTPPGGPALRTLSGHTETVTTVAVTVDGRHVVSGSSDKTLKVWDLESGKELQILRGHTRQVNSVAVTTDGRLVVSGSADNTIKVWDLESGKELQTLRDHSSIVCAVAVTTDGRHIITGSGDQTIKIWNLESGKELQTLRDHTDAVRAVAVTTDGRHVVSGSNDKTIKVWDLDSGKKLQTLKGHTASVSEVAVTADDRHIVSGCSDRTIKIWDLESGQELQTFRGHTDYFPAIAVTADGRLVVSGSNGKTLKVWDLENGKELQILRGHTRQVKSVAVTADGRHAITSSDDKTLKVWDLESGKKPQTLRGHTGRISAVAVTADGQHAITSSDDKTLKVWDLESGKELQTLRGHAGRISAVAVTADGQHVVSGSSDKTLIVWDLESGKELQTLKGHMSWITALVVTVDGRHVVSGSDDKTLKVWDLESGKELQTLRGHTDRIRALAVTADGRHVVSGSSDKTLKVWDLESGKELQTLRGHRKIITAVAVTTDGRHVVSGSDDETLKVWDLESGKKLQTLKGHMGWITALVVTVDGRHAIIAVADNTLKVWDLESGKKLQTLKGHTDRVSALAVTADGRHVVSGSSDKTLKVWDLEKRKAIATFFTDGELSAVQVCSDGATIVAGDISGSVHILELENFC